MKKLSIIIPCYNCSKTIGRLLDSIISNNLKKNEYEVIICDDKSTDNFMDIVKQYKDKIDISYCTTTREIHCPGNTRQVGLEYIKGEWFTFIDNDDMFEPDAFNNVFNAIEKEKVEYVLCTNFRGYNAETDEYNRNFIGDQTDTWLHGKFFNTENVLKKCNAHFKDDLMSHEDVYFNSCILAYLISINKDYVYYPIFTYKWVDNKESLSRSYFDKKHYYIDTYLDDYLIGSSYPFFEMHRNVKNQNHKNFAFNQIMMTLLHGYFYYQANLWRLGTNDTLEGSYNALKKLKRKIVKELNITDFDIVNYIYSLPKRYNNVKQSCFIGTCYFIEVQSFRDFIINL